MVTKLILKASKLALNVVAKSRSSQIAKITTLKCNV